jgi:N-carbamoyl-L-amino-acid hydrolase
LIQVDRIEADLYRLSEFGYNAEDRGVYRQGFSDADMESRRWLMDRFRENGMTARMDGAGNVIGRYGPEEGPAVLIGSHLDSVPCGGMFDGTLGVMAGLECVRVIRERNIALRHPVEVIATSEEEGRFGGMLGAQALTGALTLDWLNGARDSNGVLLTDAMSKQGLDPHLALHARKPPESVIAFLELHIEQGPVLEIERKTIGVVEGISGVFKWLVRLIGKADHAGTAPMHMRSDAFMGVADFAHEMGRILGEEGTDRSRLTIGKVALKPGYAHTIPGEADFTLVGRDLDEAVMKQIAVACRRVLSAIARKHRLRFEYTEMSWLPPKPCDPGITSLLESTAETLGYSRMRMPSGAGHDTQFFSDIAPSGMIFIPSKNGVSHAPDEWSHWGDVEKGANVLLHALLQLAAPR